MRRHVTAILGLALLLAGCGGGEAATTSVVTTTAPTTTEAPSTTRAPTTTTTTTAAPGVSVADLVAPIEVLEGFRFTATALDDDGEAGLVADGVFVAPDAVSCTVGNPAWISPVLGTTTAIGGDAWWSDSMHTNLHARDDSFVTDGLRLCPGAPEFWEEPLMSEEVFALGDPVPGEEIEGFATDRFTLSPLDPAVVLDEASLWVTTDGWPIKMQVHGTAPGGVVAVRGGDAEEATAPKEFTLGYELTDINRGSLAVRSPDGSVTAGPIGGVEISLPDLGAPSPELQAAVDTARGGRCVTTNTPLAVLEPLGLEAGLGSLEVVGTYEGLEGATQISVGSFFLVNEGDRVVTTAGREDARRAHALLFYGHVAPIVAFFHGTDMLDLSPYPLDESGRLDLGVWSGTDEASPRVATWDAAGIRFADGTSLEMSPADLMHFASGEILDDQVAEEAWERAGTFASAAVEVIPALASGDPQALVDMWAIGGQLDEMRAVGCALLGHQWAISEAMMGQSVDASVGIPIMAKEIKAQELLLFFDYLQVMVRYLERPEVDWLEAEGVVLEDTILPEDTAGEYLTIITRAAQNAYAFMGAFDM